MRNLFYEKLNSLEFLLSQKITKGLFVEKIRSLINEPQLKKHFYANLSNREWLPILFEVGEFSSVPDPIQNTNTGELTHPDCPFLSYLIRIATLEQKAVVNIVKKISPSKNRHLISAFIHIAKCIDPGLAIQLIPRINEDIEIPIFPFIAFDREELIIHLLNGGQYESAISLAKKLLELQSDRRTKSQIEEAVKYTFNEPRARFEQWEYKQSLYRLVPMFKDCTDLDGLNLFCQLLYQAVQLTKSPDVENSYIYTGPPAIEDHEQNRHSDTPKDQLVWSVRKIAEGLIKEYQKELLETIDSYDEIVFKRISLHLRAWFPGIDSEGSSKLLYEEGFFEEIEIHHERYKLLENSFDDLKNQAQEKYFEFIDSGFDEQIRIDVDEALYDHTPTVPELESMKAQWQFERYFPIREYLSDDHKVRYERLSKEHKTSDHPDFNCYFYGIRASEPAIKKDVEQLAEMNIEELINHLHEVANHEDHDLWVHSQKIERIVEKKPDRYAAVAQKLSNVHRVPARGFIAGWFNALKGESAFDYKYWSNILQFCKNVTEKIVSSTGEADNDYVNGTLKSILDLFCAGMVHSKCKIPEKESSNVWVVLESLSKYPDPSFKSDAEEDSKRDPTSIAINTVRPEALDSIVCYSNWQFENADAKGETLSFEQLPEVRAVLDTRIDLGQEKSDAVRLVFGKKLPFLCKIDKIWTKQNLSKIFGSPRQFSESGKITWSAYLKYNRSYTKVYPVIWEYYALAIENIGTFPESSSLYSNPDERLAEHLSILYTLGCIPLEDPDGLIKMFFKKAPIEHRTRFLETPVLSLDQTEGTIESEIIERLKRLWEWRIEVIEKQGDKTYYQDEARSFGFWFTCDKFDTKSDKEWRITHLLRALKVHGDPTPSDHVAASLEEFASDYPDEVIQALVLMVEGTSDDWQIQLWKDHIEPIVRIVKEKGTKENVEQALDLLNKLGSRGFWEFRELATELKDER